MGLKNKQFNFTGLSKKAASFYSHIVYIMLYLCYNMPMEQMKLFNDNIPEKKQKRKLHNKVTFKEYQQDQMMLPMSLSDIIPTNHVVKRC